MGLVGWLVTRKTSGRLACNSPMILRPSEPCEEPTCVRVNVDEEAVLCLTITWSKRRSINTTTAHLIGLEYLCPSIDLLRGRS